MIRHSQLFQLERRILFAMQVKDFELLPNVA